MVSNTLAKRKKKVQISPNFFNGCFSSKLQAANSLEWTCNQRPATFQVLCLMKKLRKPLLNISVWTELMLETWENTGKCLGKHARYTRFAWRQYSAILTLFKRKWLLPAHLRKVNQELITLLQSQGTMLWFDCLSSKIFFFSETWLLVS